MAYVWQCSVVQFKKATLVYGVILKDKPFNYSPKTSNIASLVRLLRSYKKRPLIKTKIKVSIGNQTFEVTTDTKGSYQLFTEKRFDSNDEITFADASGQFFEWKQDYKSHFDFSESNSFIVSDIDDTIMVSHSAIAWKRITTLLFKTPQKRKVIPFSKEVLINHFSNDSGVCYVSKSESNLFNMISTFIVKNQLPKGALFLTPYLSFSELIKEKKGKLHKKKYIELFLENTDNATFTLIGDDSQKDMIIYHDIAIKFPDRIKAVYIRQTRKKRNKYQQKNWEKLNRLPQKTHYFKANCTEEDAIAFLNL